MAMALKQIDINLINNMCTQWLQAKRSRADRATPQMQLHKADSESNWESQTESESESKCNCSCSSVANAIALNSSLSCSSK